MFKKIIIALLLMFIIPINAVAYSDKIIAGGENIGITLNFRGVLIVGSYNVNGENLAKKANLKNGDIITKINNNQINNIDEMAEQINEVAKNNLPIKITFVRNNEEKNT